MAQQFGTTLRNAWLDAYESTIGTAPLLVILTGSQPANCAAAETGTRLSVLTLPSDWMAAASGGSKSKSGTWQDLTADNSGTAGYFRVMNSGDTICHHQGSVSVSGGGGDLILSTVTFTAGDVVTINTWTIAAPGA